MPRPIFAPRGSPARGLPDGSVDTSELAASAVTQSKLGADSVGLTAISDPIRRRTMTVHLGTNLTSGDLWPIMRAGAEAPQITGCYVNCGVQMYHAAGEADTWTFQLRNITKNLSLARTGASLSNVTLTATAWRSIPLRLGNSTLISGDTLQFHLTESGTAQTIDQMLVMIEWQPTANT